MENILMEKKLALCYPKSAKTEAIIRKWFAEFRAGHEHRRQCEHRKIKVKELAVGHIVNNGSKHILSAKRFEILIPWVDFQ